MSSGVKEIWKALAVSWLVILSIQALASAGSGDPVPWWTIPTVTVLYGLIALAALFYGLGERAATNTKDTPND